jgi:pyridoxal phosphate enzyme (YggS family)
MTEVAENCLRVLERIERAAARSGRSGQSVRLVAVTKTVSVERIEQAIAAGITHFGESKLQEATPKLQALAHIPGLTWHFIGHLQTNKAKRVAEHFDYVHSVDRFEVAEGLLRGVPAGDRLPVLLEVKLDDRNTKGGVAPSDLKELADRVRTQHPLQLNGLMAIPPAADDPELARPHFRKLRNLAQTLELPELSMGMTHDFEVAIEEGATMVRIGTAIFGSRP